METIVALETRIIDEIERLLGASSQCTEFTLVFELNDPETFDKEESDGRILCKVTRAVQRIRPFCNAVRVSSTFEDPCGVRRIIIRVTHNGNINSYVNAPR